LSHARTYRRVELRSRAAEQPLPCGADQVRTGLAGLGHATVDEQFDTGDEARGVAGEEDDCFADFARGAQTAERVSLTIRFTSRSTFSSPDARARAFRSDAVSIAPELRTLMRTARSFTSEIQLRTK